MEHPQQFSLHKRLESEHGRITVVKFRDWEKAERSLARYRNHLHFTLHCKHHHVIPVSLRLPSRKSPAAQNIIKRAERALMCARISEIYVKIAIFKDKIAAVDEELFTRLPSNLYTEVHDFCTHARRSEWDKCRTCQVNKFDILLDKAHSQQDTRKTAIAPLTKQDVDNTKSRWVINK